MMYNDNPEPNGKKALAILAVLVLLILALIGVGALVAELFGGVI